MEFFEPFWDSGEPRAGEKGARGWRAWMHQQEWGGWVAVGAGEAPLGGGPAASSSGVFRFPGLLVCAGRSSGAQERCADPANGLGAQAVLPLRHPEAAPTAPAKRSGKSTQGASVRPSPRRPGGGGRCW